MVFGSGPEAAGNLVPGTGARSGAFAWLRTWHRSGHHAAGRGGRIVGGGCGLISPGNGPAAPPAGASRPEGFGGIGLADLIACPTCDTLHRAARLEPGQTARCVRCGTVLLRPRANAMTRIVMLSAAAVVLMAAAMVFPFLSLRARGLFQSASVADAILVFSQGRTLPLTLALAALVVILPLARLGAIVYALAPMAIGWRPARGARRAFRWAEAVRPWAMRRR